MADLNMVTETEISQIESRAASPISLMPQGLVNGMNADEIRDLIAYILSGGDAKHAAFR